MFKKSFIAVLALVLAQSTASFAQKFGYCNSLALLAELPEVKQADSDLQAYQTQLQKKGQEMVKAFQEKAQELQRKQEQGTISPKDFSEQEAKLTKEQEDINKYAQEVDQKLGQKREELYKPILEKVNAAMQEVAKAGGYTMVFDTSTQVLLFADESMDVTKEVIAKLTAQK
ncbi:MAG: OmpH family outer membrane protein [Chitinophagales bacterium]|jgi:outer membrane protein